MCKIVFWSDTSNLGHFWVQSLTICEKSWREMKEWVLAAFSETWWRVCTGLWLHFCQWCWGFCPHGWDHECWKVQVLLHYAIPSGKRLTGNGFIYQHDNDPTHTANAVKSYLERKTADKILTVMDWPPHSPDLNIIEAVWDHLDRERNKIHLKKNSGKCWKKPGIIYQKTTTENFSPKEFKMWLVPSHFVLKMFQFCVHISCIFCLFLKKVIQM